jgi:hypothetical protein
MNAITRHVRDIEIRDRQALEHLLGLPLSDNQRVMIQIDTVPSLSPANGNQSAVNPELPDWCDVFAGLSEKEIAEVQAIALSRADLSRSSE